MFGRKKKDKYTSDPTYVKSEYTTSVKYKKNYTEVKKKAKVTGNRQDWVDSVTDKLLDDYY